MPSTLGLDDDLDPTVFCMDVEATFDLTLPEDTFSRCKTVGDIFQIVLERLPEVSKSGEGCATAMCFYSLRRVLRQMVPHLDVRPSTPVSAFGRLPMEAFCRRIVVHERLNEPELVMPGWGYVAMICAIALPFLAMAVKWPVLPAFLASGVMVWLCRFIPRRLPAEVKTVGDLVRSVASRNVARLAGKGARLGPKEVWSALCHISAAHSELDLHPHQIRADTLLLDTA